MKAIITGASGFVGSHLTRYLSGEGIETLSLSLRNKDWKNNNLQADVWIHLAGKAHDTDNTSTAQEYFTINTDLTIELFDKFLQSEGRDFFYFSSVKAAADTVEHILTEEVIPDPKTPYGKSKIEAEKYLLSARLPIGKRLFIIRPCMIHGPGNKGNLNVLFQLVSKGLPWPLASFANERSFISIDNVNYLMLQLIKNTKINSGIYNFADDEKISTNELVTIMGNVLEKKVMLWRIPKKWVSALARLGDVLKFPLNSERLKKLTENYWVSNKKIKKALEIDQLPITAVDGLNKTIKSFKK